MITFEALDCDTADLALELWHDDDTLTLDEASALAFDMQAVIASCALEWDQEVGDLAAQAYEATGDPEAFDTMCAALSF